VFLLLFWNSRNELSNLHIDFGLRGAASVLRSSILEKQPPLHLNEETLFLNFELLNISCTQNGFCVRRKLWCTKFVQCVTNARSQEHHTKPVLSATDI
jgi:hypothetical protein